MKIITTDHQQAAKILHKIIDTHYLTIQPMNNNNQPAAQSEKEILLLRLIKVTQAIVDVDYACFEKPRLEPYRKQLAEQKRGIELIIALVKNDPHV